MKRLMIALLALSATPAFAEGDAEPFFTLHNAEFVVTVAFIVFVGLVIYLGVPKLVGRMLDDRARLISNELDEARLLREEAKALLGSYDKKMEEVQAQSERIIASAKEEAQAAAKQAKEELKSSIARRLVAAEEQIASAEASAIRQVRESAISVAVAAAGEVLASQSTAGTAAASIDAAIAQVDAKFH